MSQAEHCQPASQLSQPASQPAVTWPPLSGLYARGELCTLRTVNFSVKESKRSCRKSSSSTPQQRFRGQHFFSMTRHSGAPSPPAPPRRLSQAPRGPGWRAARATFASSPPLLSLAPPLVPLKAPRALAELRLPSLAFFLLARVPPSFPRKESSFFREGGDLGVGDLGEEGDF